MVPVLAALAIFDIAKMCCPVWFGIAPNYLFYRRSIAIADGP
jgi:hypothetical protein